MLVRSLRLRSIKVYSCNDEVHSMCGMCVIYTVMVFMMEYEYCDMCKLCIVINVL